MHNSKFASLGPTYFVPSSSYRFRFFREGVVVVDSVAEDEVPEDILSISDSSVTWRLGRSGGTPEEE